MQSLNDNPRKPTVPWLLPKMMSLESVHLLFLHCRSARSPFSFVRGSPKGHAANKQTCTILLQLVSEERTKSSAICAGVMKQRSPAGSQGAGSGLPDALRRATDAGFLVQGTMQHWQRGSGCGRASCLLKSRYCPIPPSHSELYCGYENSQMSRWR